MYFIHFEVITPSRIDLLSWVSSLGRFFHRYFRKLTFFFSLIIQTVFSAHFHLIFQERWCLFTNNISWLQLRQARFSGWKRACVRLLFQEIRPLSSKFIAEESSSTDSTSMAATFGQSVYRREHAAATHPWNMYPQHFHVCANVASFSLLYVPASRPCCISPQCVPQTFCRCMSLQHITATCPALNISMFSYGPGVLPFKGYIGMCGPKG